MTTQDLTRMPLQINARESFERAHPEPASSSAAIVTARFSDLRQVKSGIRRWALVVWLALLVIAAPPAPAFPPAPHHTLFGIVRNQWGNPIDVTGAQVFILGDNGAGVASQVAASAEPGVNYRMRVPMDTGLTADLYQATALRHSEAFRLKVVVGFTTYLPLEMTLGPSQLGAPGGTTRLDLTLGVDSDGDGLPDAWEQAIIAFLGGTLEGITPDGDADGDGLSNLDEYLAGTFAFDPNDGFSLELAALNADAATLQFLAMRGRTYTIHASSDLKLWTPVPFRILSQSIPGSLQTEYASQDIRQLEIEVPFQTGPEPQRYFKALVR